MTERRHKILVVDDLPDWRKTLRGLLVDEGHEVEEAGSFSGALDALKDNQFDLVIADVRLDESDTGNTDGVALATRIKEQWPGTKVIVITGYDTQTVVKRAMAPGLKGESLVADFIPKTETDKLPQIVLRVLEP